MKNALNLSAIFLAIVFYCGCNANSAREKDSKTIPTDTSKITKTDTINKVKIANRWVTPKKDLEFNTLISDSQDTLSMAICSNYVYWPFGKIKDASFLKKSLLNNFNITTRTDSTDIGPEKFQILKLKNSKLILFFDNDPEGSTHSDILKGEITDPEVRFVNGVRIGMPIAEFYKVFFDNAPGEIQQKYRNVEFDSCVQDIKHIYTFNNGRLTSIKFISDTYWKIDY